MSNIVTIAEHSVDISLLPEKANILDIGCRGFQFTDEMRRLGHVVCPVDIDDLIGSYYQIAISDFNGFVSIERGRDPQATRIGKKGYHEPTPIDHPTRSVESYTLKKLSETINIPFFDLIKMDIEGSEYDVIMSLTEPPAKQLSIEFHLHTKVYGDAQVKEMEDKLLSLGYYPVKHDKTQAHGCGWNYWDSLFILQE